MIRIAENRERRFGDVVDIACEFHWGALSASPAQKAPTSGRRWCAY